MSKQQCIFCDIISGTIPAKTVGSTIDSIAFMDAFPIVAGHVLVVPKRHCEKIQDMSETECTFVPTGAKYDKKSGHVDWLDTVAAHNGKESGQEIPHVHVHHCAYFVAHAKSRTYFMVTPARAVQSDMVFGTLVFDSA